MESHASSVFGGPGVAAGPPRRRRLRGEVLDTR
jgi:hypothetical protein